MKQLALVLGSGGFRGAAHIGVLTRLRDLRVPVYAMVGCSVGSLITAYYAALGLPVEDILEYAIQTGIVAVAAHALSLWDGTTASAEPPGGVGPSDLRPCLVSGWPRGGRSGHERADHQPDQGGCWRDIRCFR